MRRTSEPGLRAFTLSRETVAAMGFEGDAGERPSSEYCSFFDPWTADDFQIFLAHRAPRAAVGCAAGCAISSSRGDGILEGLPRAGF